MIVERLQHFVRSLNDLTDGTPKKLVFFRIGGVSSSSRIEYEVKGNMVGFTDHVKEFDTQLLRYLRGALDVEVVPNKKESKAGMRVDLYMVIWKSMSNISEDDAEQLFWGEPDVGIIKSVSAGRRVQQGLRTPFSEFLLQYYDSKPKPVQSLFVDHPEKDAESFYRQLLTLLAVGELECVLLGEELPETTLTPEPDAAVPAIEEARIPEPEELPATVLEPEKPDAASEPEPGPEIADLPTTTLEAQDEIADVDEHHLPGPHTGAPEIPDGLHVEQDEDDYIDSLINTKALEARIAKHAGNGKPAGTNGKGPDSLKLLFKGTAPEEEGKGLHDGEETTLDLLSEAGEDEIPTHYLENDTSGEEVNKEDLDELLNSFDTAFDAPLPKEKPTKKQQAKKIAGLEKMLKAAKKGF